MIINYRSNFSQINRIVINYRSYFSQIICMEINYCVH